MVSTLAPFKSSDQEETAQGRIEGFFQGHGGILEEASRL